VLWETEPEMICALLPMAQKQQMEVTSLKKKKKKKGGVFQHSMSLNIAAPS